LFAQCETRIHAIFNFLALLELAQQKFISILIGTGRNNFIMEWQGEGESEGNVNDEETQPDGDAPEAGLA
jgi:segregation and condensation protein A